MKNVLSDKYVEMLMFALQQGRIFIFGALGYFKLEAPLEGLRWLMSYKSALNVLATFSEQLVPPHKHITLFWIPSISGTRAVSASLHTPNWGPHCHIGPKIQSLTPPNKISTP